MKESLRPKEYSWRITLAMVAMTANFESCTPGPKSSQQDNKTLLPISTPVFSVETPVTSTTTPTETRTVIPTVITPSPTETTRPTETKVLTQTPTPEKPTVTPTEKAVIYVFWGITKFFSSPSGESIGTVASGKEFVVVKEQDDWFYIKLSQGAEGWIQKSDTAYGLVGTKPPEKPTVEPIRNFPREIVFGNGQLIIENMGTRHGVVVSEGGFKDKNGNFCPGDVPCEGQKGYDTGLREENRRYIEEMFARYGAGKGNLKIFFYDNSQDDPFYNQGLKGDFWYKYVHQVGGTIEIHVGVNEKYDPALGGWHWQVVLSLIDQSAIVPFLYGRDILNPTPGARYPDDLVAIVMASKFDIK